MNPFYTPTKVYQNSFKTLRAIMFADRMTRMQTLPKYKPLGGFD